MTLPAARQNLFLIVSIWLSLIPTRIGAGEPLAPAPASAPVAEPPASTAHASPLTLADCYRLALARSETIAINAELVKETEGRFLQALSTALPRVSFVSSDKRQDGSGSSAFTLRDVPERRFTFSQPLFSGLKEFAAIAGSRAERRERLEDKRRAEHLLLLDVANAFYLLLEYWEELSALEATRLALVQRADELKERETLGRSRASEVVSAEAQLRRIEADIQELRREERVARQLLEFLTGRDRIEGLVDTESPLPPLQPEANYLAHADVRPDLRAAEETWHVAEKEVGVVRAQFWPTVSAEGNYYVERAGAAEDVKWDATLKLDVPIFQGGQAVGASRETSSKARQAKLRYDEAQRRVQLDIRDAYARYEAALAVHDALQKALAAAEENYRLQVDDYRHSLISNLDVLQTLQELQDARRNTVHAKYDAKRLYWQLRVATGETL